MKFLADMGISQSTVAWLREKGYEAIHLREQALHRMSDEKITMKAAHEERIILTCDIDFSDIMAASGEICPSVILFRLHDETPQNVNKRIENVLETSSDALKQGAIITVEELRHRVRILPIKS